MDTDAQKALDNINKMISRNRMSEKALEDEQRQKALSDPKMLKERQKSARRIAKRSRDKEKNLRPAPTSAQSSARGQKIQEYGQSLKEPVDFGIDIGGFKIPTTVGLLASGVGNFMRTRIYDVLQRGGTPVYNTRGDIVGARDQFGRLTGQDPEALLQARIDKMNRSESSPSNFLAMSQPVASQTPSTAPTFSMADLTLPYQTDSRYFMPSMLDQPFGLLDFYQMYGLEAPETEFTSQPMYSSPYAYEGYSLLS